MGNLTNIELITLLKKGDMAAFDEIYNKYCHRLFNFVVRYLKQKEDTEEVVQEVFIKIWESRRNIDIYSSFESFLFSITYNTTISLLRKRLIDKKSRDYLKSFQEITTKENVIDRLQYDDLNNHVESLLNKLTSRQKQIYKLSREQGLSHKEIAQKLSISESTVKNHLVSVLKIIRSGINNGTTSNLLFIFMFF